MFRFVDFNFLPKIFDKKTITHKLQITYFRGVHDLEYSFKARSYNSNVYISTTGEDKRIFQSKIYMLVFPITYADAYI